MHADLLEDSYRRVDRAMLPLLWLLCIVAWCLAPQYGRWTTALVAGAVIAGIPTILILCCPGRLLTRLSVAAALMAFAALHIHLLSGMNEMHFGVFVLLSLLLAYRDWRVISCGALVIAVHHLSFNYLQAWGYGIYCFTEPGLEKVLLHATYVVVQTAALSWLAWRSMPPLKPRVPERAGAVLRWWPPKCVPWPNAAPAPRARSAPLSMDRWRRPAAAHAAPMRRPVW